MPKYAFLCKDCHEPFEEKRPFSQASAPASCPSCEGDNTKKLLTAVAFNSGKQSIPVPMTAPAGGCCGGGSCGCHQ